MPGECPRSRVGISPPPNGRKACPEREGGQPHADFGGWPLTAWGTAPSSISSRKVRLTVVHGSSPCEQAVNTPASESVMRTFGRLQEPPRPGRLSHSRAEPTTQDKPRSCAGWPAGSGRPERHRDVHRIRRLRNRPDRQHRDDFPVGLRAVLPPPSARRPLAGLRRAQHRHLRRDLAADQRASGRCARLRALRDPVDHPAAVEHRDPAGGRLLLCRPSDGPGQRDGPPRPAPARADQCAAAGRNGDRRQQAAARAHPAHGRPPGCGPRRRRRAGRRPGAPPGRDRTALRGQRRRLRAPDHARRRALPRGDATRAGAGRRAAAGGHAGRDPRRRRRAGRRPGAPPGRAGPAPPRQGHRLRARHHGGRGDLPRLDAGCAPEPGRARRSLGQNGFGQNGFGQNGFGQNGFGQNGFGQNGFGQNGFGQNGSGQNSVGQGYEAQTAVRP